MTANIMKDVAMISCNGIFGNGIGVSICVNLFFVYNLCYISRFL